MRIHLYTVCWNEADMLGFFFRQYDPIVDRYLVYDNGSTDGSLDILNAHPKVELRRFEQTHAESFVLSHQQFQNEAWKESRHEADWVIVTAIDEHLEVAGRNNRKYLKSVHNYGVTLIPAIGLQMISEDEPRQGERLASTRTLGAFWDVMSKLSVFDPNKIVETNFTVGRHGAMPIGETRLPRCDELMLLHYKYLGFERTLARQAALGNKIGPADRANNFGYQYFWSPERLRADWDHVASNCVDISTSAFLPYRIPGLTRWWRPEGFVDVNAGGQLKAGSIARRLRSIWSNRNE